MGLHAGVMCSWGMSEGSEEESKPYSPGVSSQNKGIPNHIPVDRIALSPITSKPYTPKGSSQNKGIPTPIPVNRIALSPIASKPYTPEVSSQDEGIHTLISAYRLALTPIASNPYNPKGSSQNKGRSFFTPTDIFFLSTHPSAIVHKPYIPQVFGPDHVRHSAILSLLSIRPFPLESVC
eukprot:gene564-1974_t